MIATLLPIHDSLDVAVTGQCRLERETFAAPRELIQTGEHYPSRRNGCALGVEWRQSRGDQVAVDEQRHSGLSGEVFAGERRLDCAVRAGNYQDPPAATWRIRH